MKIALLTSVWLFPAIMIAQGPEWGVSILGWNYQGDMTPGTTPYVPETSPGFGLFYRYNLNNQWALRGQVQYGKVSGDDRNFEERANANPLLDFSTRLMTGTGMVEFNLLGRERRRLPLYDASGRRLSFDELKARDHELYDEDGNRISYTVRLTRPVSPYLTAGAGALYFDPTIHSQPANGADMTAKEIQQEYSKISFITPVGAGLKFYLNDTWTLGVEGAVIPTFGDYLDGTSDSRDPEDNDWLSYLGVQLSWRSRDRDTDGDGVADREDACPRIPGVRELAGCPDADGDGITDSEDECPQQAGSAVLHGCPDSDGDGLADKEDACPWQAGTVALHGCPDSDGDGVADSEDLCPTEAGPVKLSGCPDTDADGIADKDDACPTRPGKPELAGCPDSDGDGVPDREDECPEVAGPRNLAGCPDADGDGVSDIHDKCPGQKGSRASQGCPEIETTDLEKISLATRNVQFRTNQTRLRSSSAPALRDLIGIMKKYPSYHLRIEGHTDSDGDDAANLKLSQGRAKSCFDFLVSKGVSPIRMTHTGFGETRPLADNATEAGKTANRRVVFELFLP